MSTKLGYILTWISVQQRLHFNLDFCVNKARLNFNLDFCVNKGYILTWISVSTKVKFQSSNTRGIEHSPTKTREAYYNFSQFNPWFVTYKMGITPPPLPPIHTRSVLSHQCSFEPLVCLGLQPVLCCLSADLPCFHVTDYPKK